jgi:hypothetical protein
MNKKYTLIIVVIALFVGLGAGIMLTDPIDPVSTNNTTDDMYPREFPDNKPYNNSEKPNTIKEDELVSAVLTNLDKHENGSGTLKFYYEGAYHTTEVSKKDIEKYKIDKSAFIRAPKSVLNV